MNRSKKLVRTTDDQWVAGVCGGLARYLGVDPSIVRLGFVVLTVLGLGSMILVYLAAWLLMPKDA